MAKYLVTGGAGFIGSNLARYILGKGHDVAVLDDLSTGKAANLSDLTNAIQFIEGDIRDRATVYKAIAGCQAIFHEGARPSVPRSVADPVTCHDVNVNGTVNILEAARAAGVNRVVFAGSSSAYGEQPISPKREDMPVLPISPYAASTPAVWWLPPGSSRLVSIRLKRPWMPQVVFRRARMLYLVTIVIRVWRCPILHKTTGSSPRE